MRLLLIAAALVIGADSFGDVTITTFTHSDLQLEHGGKVIHVDPWSVSDLSKAKPADLILITDDVGHHLDAKAIARVRKPGAPVVIPATGKKVVPDGIVMANGETRVIAGITIEATPAYDVTPGESFHPRGEANGYIVTIGAPAKRFYIAGVTYVARRVPDAMRASGQALMVAVTYGVGGLVGYLGAGSGYEWLGGFRLFAVAAALELVPALLILGVREASVTRAELEAKLARP